MGREIMNEHEMPPIDPEFEARLQEYYASPTPSPDFTGRLEERLRQHHTELVALNKPRAGPGPRFWSQFLGPLRERAWQIVITAILLALVVATLAIGPGRVLAQVQQWFGYLPGFGFVDLDQARILAEPVIASQEGVTLQVDQMLAEPDRTRVILTIQGFPPQKNSSWFNQNEDMSASLLLPDGEKVETTTYGTSLSQGIEVNARLEFPALPEEIHQVTLQIDRLPYIPEGSAPENWQIPLILVPARGDLPKDLLPPSFTPPDASATANGVTVRILQVAYSQAETALQVQFGWCQPDWELSYAEKYSLIDDVGHQYQFPTSTSTNVEEVVIVPPGPQPTSALPLQTVERTYLFAPVSQAANRATFALEEVQFSLPVSATFSFDPGPDPRPGQTWSLDEWFPVGGFKLHFTQVRMIEEMPNNPDEQGPVYYFEFPFEVEQETDRHTEGLRRLDMISIDPQIPEFTESRSEGSWVNDEYSFAVGYDAVPGSPLTFLINEIFISVPGPWEISRDVPRFDDSRPKIRTLYPQNAFETHAGTGLQVEKVIFSDRISVIDLIAPGLPPGMNLLEISPRDPRFLFSEGEVSLRDQSGKQLVFTPDANWLVGGEITMAYDPHNLQFGPIDPTVESLTLQIPGVELFAPGQASLEVTLPEGLEVHPEEYTLQLPENYYPETERTLTRWVSQPWSVDLALDIAGYKLHFDQAQLEKKGSLSERSYQLVLTGNPAIDNRDGYWLNQVHIATVTRPDGSSGWAVGGIRFQPAEANQPEAYLIIEVTAPDGIQPLPGPYQVTLDGATVWVPGPWELTWPVSP
jgi:hypothetical protein